MIFQNAIWQNTRANQALIETYTEKFHTEPIMTQLLIERGFETKEEVEAFLNPSMSTLYNPFLLLDMDKAVNRIEQAIQNDEKIWLYGDYDVDGITSISILYKYFEYVGVQVGYYIPDRHDEGYGVSEIGLDYIKAKGGQLVITVDCGITAVDQVQYGTNLGLDIIVTDHHECQDEIPNALAVVNPKRGGYPFKMLAGCGVAFKLAQALAKDGFSAFYPRVIDILALGTIADIVPLVDENRVFTKFGLEAMQSSTTPGIRALINEANLTNKEINAGHIGFVIAPRINASGRIGNPTIAVEMLTTHDAQKAESIARELSELNVSRQSREKEIMEEALDYIDHHIDLDIERVLLVVGKNWHTGIIGIVASKLSERFSRPTVILNEEEGVAKGSARSIDGISIFEVLSHFKHLYSKFGGHEQAAGLSLPAENVPLLKAALIAYGEEAIPKYRLKLTKTVSGYLEPRMVTHKLMDEIEKLKPFGLGNPKPQFIFENLVIEDFKVIGKQQNHIKLMVNDGVRMYDALAFNQSDMSQFIRKNDRIHLLLYLEKNHFMGVETIQFMIRDYIKEKMPLDSQLLFKAHKALYQFLIKEQDIRNNSKFTRTDDFDIIFSAPLNDCIFIYTFEGLIKIKDYIFKKNIYNYTLHFNQIDENEVREGYRNIIFMPYSQTLSTVNSGFIYDEAITDKALAAHIPDRNDLAIVYKKIKAEKIGYLSRLVALSNLSAPKCLLCLELLKEMALIAFQLDSNRLTIDLLPQPSQKIDMEQVALYQHLMTSWRHF